MEIFLSIIKHELFLTWIGATFGHILSFYKPEFKRTIPFFEKLIPDKNESFYFRLDFIILPLMGALLGFSLLTPIGPQASIFAGLTWSGSLLALLKTDNSKPIVKPQIEE